MIKIFKEILVKQELLDRDNNPICGDIIEEFNELPSNYIRTYYSKNSSYKYYIIRNVYKPFIFTKIFKNKNWFDSYKYDVVTNMIYRGRPLKFSTEYLIAIDTQINLQIELLYETF